MLSEFCERNNAGWNVTCPAGGSLPKMTLKSLLSNKFPVFAAAPALAMNPGFALAAYATICGHLKQPLRFPGGIEAWQSHISHITGKLNGYFAEWVVLTEETKNQKFNIHDNSFFTCESLWPKLAGWYGIDWTGPEETGLTEVEFGHSPPPRGYGPRALIRYKFNFEDWAASPDVKQAWTELAEKHDLVCKDLNQLTQALKFGNTTVQQPGALILSMDKARKLGWHGYVDTYQGLLEVFDEFAKLKMIPNVPKISVRFP
ncbi:hypothetical protein NW755_014034 [Fusarium falciforme]|uniref:Uncharacterized protein n=1 Tax=Fusarium falciforme TaxID=195108 RepID=A0A9W8QTG0_9HYPO|nr:hypothetical protein NW755_014034 [Fusarium falciforme]